MLFVRTIAGPAPPVVVEARTPLWYSQKTAIMPAVKPAKTMPMVMPMVIATVECMEGSLTKELFASVARREVSIFVGEVVLV